MNKLKLVLSNPHTSISAAIYIGAKAGAQLGAVWFPQHAAQFQDTANIIESLAVGYGLLAAGDASQSLQKPDPSVKPDQKPDEPAPPKP